MRYIEIPVVGSSKVLIAAGTLGTTSVEAPTAASVGRPYAELVEVMIAGSAEALKTGIVEAIRSP